MLKEFKEFAMKGNVLDLAIGVIIGGAFGNIVSSLVADIIMPLVGLLIGGVNFRELSATIGDVQLNYGLFIQSVVDFLIIAFSIFLFVRFANKLSQKKEAPVEETVPEEDSVSVLKDIRELLQKK